MNPFPVASEKSTGWAVISVVGLLVGVMAAMALIQHDKQDRRIRSLPADIRDDVIRADLDLTEEMAKLRAEVLKLREEKTKLEIAASSKTDLSEELNNTLQEAKVFAGLTEVEGPGVTVILKDSKKPTEELPNINDAIIHDADVVRVINELWNAGAEALTVNNKRAGPTTSYRCVGSVIVVDGARFAAPIVIRAIGDPDALYGGLNLPGGVLSEIRDLDPAMVEIAVTKNMTFEAFDGSTSRKFAKVPQKEETKPESSEGTSRRRRNN